MIFFLAASLLATADVITSVRSALDDGLPGVAISKLEGIPAAARDRATHLLLARALLANGEVERSVEVLLSLPADGERDFWLAQAYAAQGRPGDALAAYQAAKSLPAYLAEATLGEARMLRRLRRPAEALQVLEAPLDSPDAHLAELAAFEKVEAYLDREQPVPAGKALDGINPLDRASRARHDFLRARTHTLSGDDPAAIRILGGLVPTDPEMAVAAVLGQAGALDRTGQTAAAESLLEGFLSKNPEAPAIEEVFILLDRLYSKQSSPSPSELKRWMNDESAPRRRQLATFFLAAFEARLGRADRAEQLYQRALAGQEGSKNPAALELAKIRLKQGRPGDVLLLLPTPGLSPQADYLRGLAFSLQKDYVPAAEAFGRAAAAPDLAEAALFNAASCEILAGTKQRPAFDAFQKKFPDSPRLAALELEQAMLYAKSGDQRAEPLLRELAAGKEASVAASAALALVEWHFEQANRTAALADLQRVSTLPDHDRARADALAVFLADTGTGDGTDDSLAEAAALRFLNAHPGAPAEPEVLMKLGEILFRKGDFAGARMRLESLARKFPDSPRAQPALFLAAQAASRLQSPASANEAMILYEEVVAAAGPLALRARLEQAVLQTILGKPAEATAILDRLLASNPDPETRAAALMEKGKTLLSAPDPGARSVALKIWSSLASDSSLSSSWRNQAQFRIGAAHEQAGESAPAVAAYYDVLKRRSQSPPELFWFYKAGFSAARLLEAEKRWDQAIKIYELLAATDGPRRQEATSRINKIRLDNLLWDEPPPTDPPR